MAGPPTLDPRGTGAKGAGNRGVAARALSSPLTQLPPLAGTCRVGERCHVNAKGLKLFGTRFPAARVRDLASSSVLLVDRTKKPPVRFASGTLIRNNVVLCAAHSLTTVTITDLDILMFFECDAATAPAGRSIDYSADPQKWTTCSLLASQPQAKVIARIEVDNVLDYGILEIEWNQGRDVAGGMKIVTLPRIPLLPEPSRAVSRELLLIGHPNPTSQQCEPAQASVGALLQQFGPHHTSLKGNEFGYATFAASSGMSGGGVFNDSGKLVGVLLGSRFYGDPKTGAGGPCFLNLGAVRTSRRIQAWMNGEDAFSPSPTGRPPQPVILRGLK